MIEQASYYYSKKTSWKVHFNFHAAIFCFWFSIYIYAPLFSIYLESVGFSYTEVGIILGAYGVSQILLRFPLGILSDILHDIRKSLLIGGFICSFISCIIFVFFESFWGVFLARILTGITASMWVMSTVLYSNYFTLKNAEKAMGAMQFNTVATQFVCMTVSGYLIRLFGWHFPFWLGAVFSLMGVFFAWRIREERTERSTQPRIDIGVYIKETNKISGLKIITFLSMVAHAVLFITIFGFSPVMADSIGGENTQISWIMSAFFIPHALTSLSLTFFSLDRKKHNMILISSFSFTSFFLCCIPFANSLVSMSLYHAGLGLALGFIFPLLLGEVVKISPAHLKMSAMGFYQSFYAVGILIGPILAGMVAERWGLYEIFFLTAILPLLSTVITFLYRTNKDL
ncbi:putative MFS-type transporter YxlH [Siminovitchia terrae]|uniref:MFS-type transporter YxlH n=1 Tax=Siminovitchia terrae TaxID=1914933 RepID=A0ABQ4L3B1_SIMTE|nr:MFS transporter [Siminovitchia terrae]GIN98364.1 putative MFS-type transporter YxlH [Siminovitchia terrae]